MSTTTAGRLGAQHKGLTLRRDKKIDRHLYRIEQVTNTPSHVALVVRRAHATQSLILAPTETVEID